MALQKKLNELSVFFPLYNEEKNVEPLVKEALSELPKVAKKFEIILVNDGSLDKTKELAEKLQKKHKEVKLVNQKNQGYGGALKTGFKTAKYEWIFFSDGDLQFKLKELKNFVGATKNFKLLLGFRKNRAEGGARKLIMLALKVWNKVLFNFPLNIKDVDCAYKLIHRDVLKKVGKIESGGAMFSTEFLQKADRAGIEYTQIGVTHYQRKYGESSGDSFKVIKRAVLESLKLLKVFHKNNDTLKLALFSLGVFLLFLPLSWNINYMQNDDYTQYRLIEQFLGGNFELDPYIGATFYAQGLFATAFAFLFGVSKLPVLTLLVSTLALYVFSLTLNRFFSLPFKRTLFYSLFLLFNPFFLYAIWGFMTENYFMLFFVLSLYFIFSHLKTAKQGHFWIANIFIVLSYFVRQFAFMTTFAFFGYLVLTKKYKAALYQLFISLGLLFFHFRIFPITPQMYDSNLQISQLSQLSRTYSLGVIILMYLIILLLPLVINFAYQAYNKNRNLFIIMSLVLFAGFFALDSKFIPENVVFTSRLRNGIVTPSKISNDFPQLGNIFMKDGLYTTNLGGQKYTYPLSSELFSLFSFVGYYLIPFVVAAVIVYWKKLFEFELIYVAGFILLMLVSPRVFDRYLLVLIPVLILYLARFPFATNTIGRCNSIGGCNSIVKGIATVHLGLFAFLGYLFSVDLFLANKYVWNRAIELSDNGVPREVINADHSWRQLYGTDADKVYFFEYPNSKRVIGNENYELVETKKIDFPLNIYENSEVKLVKRITKN